MLSIKSVFLAATLGAAGSGPAAAQVPDPRLEVPYLSQTEALCGGAAVAMLFRYWGERHADVQQFEPLVDRRAGGIAQHVLVDAVRARGWQAVAFKADVTAIRERLHGRQPLVLLIEDRPGRYHYVVSVGASGGEVILHDPAWGPSRRFAESDFLRRWKAADNWALLILPGEARESAAAAAAVPPHRERASSSERPAMSSPCDRLLERALDEIDQRGLTAADSVLTPLLASCPDDPRPVSELAGVRFAARRWRAAEELAARATALDESYEYAWEVLGSSRFMQDDLSGALRAWNRIGKPRVDSVHIEGLSHTRYSIVAQSLALSPNALLTEREYRRAARRLQQLPSRAASRIGFRPDPDGFAVVDVALSERARRPYGPVQWGIAATQAFATREIVASVPGGNGQGEVWTASWRWWDERPRAALSFAAPRVGRLPGVWRVDGVWDVQTYALGRAGHATAREKRVHGGLTMTDWPLADLRYEVGVGVDAWDGSRRTASIGGTVERRAHGDLLSLLLHGRVWNGFRAGGASGRFSTSTEPVGFVHHARAGIDFVSSGAPLALWPGAGGGQARSGLLRAHPLLDAGIVRGPVFGRQVTAAGFETLRWFDAGGMANVAVAGFLDLAHAARRLVADADGRTQVDAGVGVRVRVPGTSGVLRMDYARGLRDGAAALTVSVVRD